MLKTKGDRQELMQLIYLKGITDKMRDRADFAAEMPPLVSASSHTALSYLYGILTYVRRLTRGFS